MMDGAPRTGAITDAEWRGMCTMLDEPEWIDDERFATTTARFENAGIRKVMTAVEIAKHDRDELLESLREAESRRPLSSPGSTCSKTRRSPRKKRSRSTTSTASGS